MADRSPGSFSGTTEYHSPEGFVTGLALAFVNTEDITIGAGRCRDSTNSVDIVNSGTLTVIIDTTDSPGANKLDTGNEETSEWYAVYVISGPGAATAGLLSKNASTPSLPATYAHFRRVGAIYNDASGDILQFVQAGTSNLRKIYWNVTSSITRLLNNATNTGSYATVSVVTAVAPTAFEYVLRIAAQAGGDNSTDFKITDIINTSVWTRARQNRSEYQITTFPCPDTQEFQYQSSHATAEVQVIIKGWSEVI